MDQHETAFTTYFAFLILFMNEMDIQWKKFYSLDFIH